MRASVIVALACYAVAASGVARVAKPEGRVVGGTDATITQYPFSAALLYSYGTVFSQACAGSIVSPRSVLSVANCFVGDPASRWWVRVGSARASSGGSVHTTAQILIHPDYDAATFDSDLAILRTTLSFVLISATVQPVSLIGNVLVQDNQLVWTIGWGSTTENGAFDDQLQHVMLRTVNQATCRDRMHSSELAREVTDNMLCAGWDVGGRGQCGGAGSPLLHSNGALLGVYSWGVGCGLALYPDVNTRVQRFTAWVAENA